MKELHIYGKYVWTIITAVKKPSVLIPAMGLSISLSSYHLMLFLLLGLLLADYITGVLASWAVWKREKKEGRFRTNGFTSEKTRLSLIKIVTYFLFIILSWFIELIFRVKPFELSWIDHEITLTFIAMAISCAIEFYSIFFENLPRAGFSIWGMLKKIVSKVKEAKNTYNDFTNGSNSTT